jgi:glycosyltransferase involved in cell wall biosynthesis
MDKIRILFMPVVNACNTNAQSLNTREIALRLDPNLFNLTLFYCTKPDHRLQGHSHIRLQRLPEHAKTVALLKEMLSGYDLIAYMDYSPASYVFLHLPRIFRRKTKAVLHVECSHVDPRKEHWMLSLLYWGVVPNCDIYTAITDRAARDLVYFVSRQTRYILPVGVDRNLFSFPRENSNLVPTVLFVGSLSKRKRPLYVLEAAARFPTIKFRIIGHDRDGHLNLLSRRIAETNLGNVTLEGEKSQTEIAKAMYESDIFLLPSEAEGIPKVTLEAAASGLPCIVFKDYETPSVVDGITGFQVATLEEMLEKLGVLISDASLRKRMGTAARKHVEQFDWNMVAKFWQEAYLGIAAR